MQQPLLCQIETLRDSTKAPNASVWPRKSRSWWGRGDWIGPRLSTTSAPAESCAEGIDKPVCLHHRPPGRNRCESLFVHIYGVSRAHPHTHHRHTHAVSSSSVQCLSVRVQTDIYNGNVALSKDFTVDD